MRPAEPAGTGRRRARGPILVALLPALAAAAVAPCAPTAVRAQTVWESPRLLPPAATGGLGVYFVRYSAFRGDGRGAFATWHPASFPKGVSLRGGAARGAGGTTAGFGGADVTAPLAAATPARPFALSWNAGAGFAVGEYLLLSVPVGLAAGREWVSGPLWLQPHVAVRTSMDLRLGAAAPADEFEVAPGLDVGLDAAFDRSRTVLLRCAVSLGDRSALAVGAVFGD